jgi:Protein of unknown function (DUF2975)
MTTPVARQLQKVQRISRFVRGVCAVLLGVSAVQLPIGLYLLITQPVLPTLRLPGITLTGVSTAGWLLALVSLNLGLATGIQMKLFLHLTRLFGLYADAKIFTADNVRQIRQLGVTVLIAPVLWLFGVASSFVFLAMTRGVGERDVDVYPLVPVSLLLAGAVIVLFSWIMDVGRELREDSELAV